MKKEMLTKFEEKVETYNNGFYVYCIICEWTPTGERSVSGDSYLTDADAIKFLIEERNCVMDGYIGVPQNGDKNRYYVKPLYINLK